MSPHRLVKYRRKIEKVSFNSRFCLFRIFLTIAISSFVIGVIFSSIGIEFEWVRVFLVSIGLAAAQFAMLWSIDAVNGFLKRDIITFIFMGAVSILLWLASISGIYSGFTIEIIK